MKFFLNKLTNSVFVFFGLCFFASCHKDPVFTLPPVRGNPTAPASQISNQSLNDIFDSLSWVSWANNLWCLQGFGDIFLRHPGSYDSAYYAGHVRIYLKFADSVIWTNLPYAAHDHAGQNNFEVYFTDWNYVVSFPPPLSAINAPRILILAKPRAFIDFSRKVSVKIGFI